MTVTVWKNTPIFGNDNANWFHDLSYSGDGDKIEYSGRWLKHINFYRDDDGIFGIYVEMSDTMTWIHGYYPTEETVSTSGKRFQKFEFAPTENIVKLSMSTDDTTGRFGGISFTTSKGNSFVCEVYRGHTTVEVPLPKINGEDMAIICGITGCASGNLDSLGFIILDKCTIKFLKFEVDEIPSNANENIGERTVETYHVYNNSSTPVQIAVKKNHTMITTRTFTESSSKTFTANVEASVSLVKVISPGVSASYSWAKTETTTQSMTSSTSESKEFTGTVTAPAYKDYTAKIIEHGGSIDLAYKAELEIDFGDSKIIKLNLDGVYTVDDYINAEIITSSIPIPH